MSRRPATREALYEDENAQYLVDLHDANSVWDFCGGMLFQLVLSDALRTHLEDADRQPVLFDSTIDRMAL